MKRLKKLRWVESTNTLLVFALVCVCGGGLFFCLFWFVVSHSIINVQTSKSCTCIHLGVPPGVNILVAVCNANFH